MLYNTYRELVRRGEAEHYWKIMPAAEQANIVALVSQNRFFLMPRQFVADRTVSENY
jgi:hypothetical protein